MLWKGKDVPEADRARVVALYEMTLSDDARLLPQMQGKPAYLILAMGADRIVRIKAQNLVANLPLQGHSLMPTTAIDIGVVLERRPARSAWLDVIWEARSVLPEPAALRSAARRLARARRVNSCTAARRGWR